MKLKLAFEVELDDHLIACIEADIPHSISYWGDVLRDPKTGRITIADRDSSDMSADPRLYPLPADWLAVGLRRLIETKLPARHALAILRGTYDAENVDCLVQVAIFNELRYG